MMRGVRRGLLFVALSLLISAATAYAECAWIVWQHIDWIYQPPGPAPTSHWGIGEITQSLAECEKRIDLSLQNAATPPDPAWTVTIDRRPGPSTVVRSVHKEKGDQIVTSYRCLPDTVDPRGPKGR
jgi:hypothetical protein